MLQAATEYLQPGTGRHAQQPRRRLARCSRRALELFDQVVREAPKDSPQARAAALGKARSLEARNELSKAIEQYELVAKTWPATPEAAEATELADALEKPEAAAFYKELYRLLANHSDAAPARLRKPDLPIGGTRGFGAGGWQVPVTARDADRARAAGLLREVKKPETKPKTEAKVDAKSASPPAKTDTKKGSTEKPKPAAVVSRPSLTPNRRSQIEIALTHHAIMWPPPLSETPQEFEVKTRTGRQADRRRTSRVVTPTTPGA